MKTETKIPKELKAIFNTWDDNADPYTECERLLIEANKLGFTFDWGLDGVPIELIKINNN